MKSNEMKIVYKPLGDLRAYENNPRHNENAVAAVAASIEKFGWKQPIVIDADGVIVAGHTRARAAERLGLQTVPCVVADDLTDEEIRAYRLADNKTAELAGWDFDKLDAELEGLDAIGFDMSEFGFIERDDDDEEMSPINDNEMEKTAAHEYKLTFGNKTVIMTEDEFADLLQRFDEYIE